MILITVESCYIMLTNKPDQQCQQTMLTQLRQETLFGVSAPVSLIYLYVQPKLKFVDGCIYLLLSANGIVIVVVSAFVIGNGIVNMTVNVIIIGSITDIVIVSVMDIVIVISNVSVIFNDLFNVIALLVVSLSSSLSPMS